MRKEAKEYLVVPRTRKDKKEERRSGRREERQGVKGNGRTGGRAEEGEKERGGQQRASVAEARS
jgi:hypothetical protein